jgi:hypothetical protein
MASVNRVKDTMEMKKRTAKQGTFYGTAQWELGYLEAAEKDARRFLTEEQYAHAVQLFDELAYEADPTKSETQDVRKIQEFHELRDKGGVLGKINLRVYFVVVEDRRLILVLAAYKKEDEGQVPSHIVTRVRNRLQIAKSIMAKQAEKG